MFQSIVFSVIAVVIVNRLLRPLAHRFGLIDVSGGRKRHANPTPLIGGIVIFIAFSLGLLLQVPLGRDFAYVLMPAALLILMAGVADDLYDLPASWRLVLEAVAVLLVIYGLDLSFDVAGYMAPNLEVVIEPIAIPLVVLAVVGMINAFNMMDGIDGLSSGVVVVALVGLLIFESEQQYVSGVFWYAVILASTVVMFMLLNLGLFTSKKVFLGDAGAMVLGFLVMLLMLIASQRSEPGVVGQFTLIDGLWCVAIPLADCLSVMVRRALAGRHPFHADRGHLHHVLLRVGFGPRATLVLVLLAASLWLSVGYAFKISGIEWMSMWVFLAYLISYIVCMVHAYWIIKKIRPVISRFKRNSAVVRAVILK